MASAAPAPPPASPAPPSTASGTAPPPTAPPPAPLTGSLRLVGTNRVPSVRTLDWTARGFTKVAGDVDVGTGKVTGTLTVGGKLAARQAQFSGTHRIEGEVRLTEDLRVRGTFRTGAGISARSARFSGTVAIAGPLAIQELLQWEGSLEVGQDVRADEVLFRGRLALHGKLSARAVSGEVDSLSSVSEIDADWIEIRRRKPRFTLFLLPPPPWHELEVQRIEAKEVHLAGVRVRYLKADRVFLGPDSHVEYVEGTILQRDKEAHVGPESESPPPPGLSR
jgi:hypothetical protein